MLTAGGGAEMSVVVLVCGNVLDGISDTLTGPAEIFVEDNRIAKVERSVGRPPGARVIDLSGRNHRRPRSSLSRHRGVRDCSM